MRHVVDDSYPGVCDQMNTRTPFIFQNFAISEMSETAAWTLVFIVQNDMP